MIKHFLSVMAIMVITLTSFGQTTKQKLDQAKNDPITTENAAKADAGLIDRKNIIDTSQKNNIIMKKEKQRCKFKRKNKATHNSS